LEDDAKNGLTQLDINNPSDAAYRKGVWEGINRVKKFLWKGLTSKRTEAKQDDSSESGNGSESGESITYAERPF
jgi:hypothetical protein